MTALMRFAPGDVARPRARQHQQTYVFEARLSTKEGPAAGIECKAGEFIWRETAAMWPVPQGGLMLAIFQVPNKFFEADGRVIDAAGEDWDEIGSHLKGPRGIERQLRQF
jgi:hypothetical protein